MEHHTGLPAHRPGWESSCSLTSMKEDLRWQTQQSSALRELLKPFQLPGRMSGRCRKAAGSHTSAGCPRLCPTAQHPSSTSLVHVSCCWCRGDKDAGQSPDMQGLTRWDCGEHTMGTLDQQSPLMAHEHTRDPQQTYPPSSKLQSSQLLKAAYCISDSFSHKNHLFY